MVCAVAAGARDERRGPARRGRSTQRSSDSIATAVARSAETAASSQAPARYWHARRAGQRHRGHDQQPFGEADVGGAVEQLAGDRDLAVAPRAGGPSGRAARSRCPAAVRGGPRASGRARRAPRRSRPSNASPFAERRRGEEGHAGVVLARAPIARRAHSMACAPWSRELAMNARRWATVAASRASVAAALPGPCEQLLGGLQVAREHRQVRPHAVAPRAFADGRARRARRRARRPSPEYRSASMASSMSRSRSPGRAVIRLAASRSLTALVQRAARAVLPRGAPRARPAARRRPP